MQQGAEVVVVVGAAVVPHRNLEEGPSDRPIPLLQGTQAVCLLPVLGAVVTTSILESAGGTYLKPEHEIKLITVYKNIRGFLKAVYQFWSKSLSYFVY